MCNGLRDQNDLSYFITFCNNSSRLVKFLCAVRVNGNRSCAKSRIASNERCSRLTRGNDPEDRNALSERELVCDREFSRSLYQRSTEVSALDERSREAKWRIGDVAVVEDTPGTNGTFCCKNRVVKPTESTPFAPYSSYNFHEIR